MTDAALAMTGELAASLAAPIDPATLPVRFSRLKIIGQSPRHYWHACQDPDHTDSLSMRIGRGAHAMLFGTPVVRFDGRRAGKEWAAFEAEHATTEILNAKEWAEAEAIAESIRQHPIATDLMFQPGTVHERQVEWSFMGRRCVSTPDSFGPAGLVDLKTTQCAAPDKFVRDGTRRSYHAQLSFYSHALNWTGPVHIVAVENKAPYVVQVFSVEAEALELGRRTWRLWFEQLLQCEAAGAWPRYTDAIVPFSVTDSDVVLSIDGEEIEL